MRTHLTRRVRAAERQIAERPPDPETTCPDAWSARFKAHSPRNAAIAEKCLRYARCPPDEHIGNVAISLCLTAGFDAWDGANVTMPPEPTTEQLEALAALEELVAAIGEYRSATEDRFPLELYGLS